MQGSPQPSFIAVRELCYRYPGVGVAALHDVTLDIPRGCSFGLLGPNGAGKTTLLSILIGLQQPQSGAVTVAGHDMRTEASAIRAASALVPQDLAFYTALTGGENLRFFASVYGLSREQWPRRRDYCVEVCGLGNQLDKPAAHYSGGLKRRLNLAIGLLNSPQILYLDEPTVGIDALSRRVIIDAIRELRTQGTTLIYTSHYLEEVESVCDEIAIVNLGRLVARGTTAELLQRETGPNLLLELDARPDAEALQALRPWLPRTLNERRLELSVGRQEDLTVITAICQSHRLAIRQLQFGVSRLERLYLDMLK